MNCYVYIRFHVLRQLPGEHEETSSLTLKELQFYPNTGEKKELPFTDKTLIFNGE